MGPKNRKIAGQRWISLILISHYNLPLPSVKISSPPFFNSVEVKFKIHHLHHEKHPTKDRNFLSLFWITAQKVVVPCYPPSTSLLPLINNFNCLWEAICMGTTIILYSDSSPHSNKVLWHPSITPHKISSSHPLVGEFRFLSSLLFCEFSPLTTLSFLSILWTRHSLHLLKLFCLKRIPSICPSPGASVYYSKHAARRAACKFINQHAIYHEAILRFVQAKQQKMHDHWRWDRMLLLCFNVQDSHGQIRANCKPFPRSWSPYSAHTSLHPHLAPLTIIRPLNSINV